MAALIAFFVATVFSIVITRIAGQALLLTGMSAESARFQAWSAFAGVGFTTTEAEQITSHPFRRRIVMWLMLLGNVGLVTLVSTLAIAFMSAPEASGGLTRLLVLGGGLVVLWLLAHNKAVNRLLTHWINRGLHRFTDLDTKDYAALLNLAGGYGVIEFEVRPDSWLAGKTLQELRLRSEGVIVLGIQRQGGDYLGVPKGAARIAANDLLILYGRLPVLDALDSRRSNTGDAAHTAAVKTEEQVQENFTNPVSSAALTEYSKRHPSTEQDEFPQV